MNDNKRQLLIEALAGTLDSLEIRYATPENRAAALADRVIEEGWQWHPAPIPEVKEEWRVIPGFSAFQASNKGFIRHAISQVWVPISQHYGEEVRVTLYDDHGRDIVLDLSAILDVTWPREGTEILFDNGNTAFIPDAQLTGESRLVLESDDILDIDPNDISLFGNKGMKWGAEVWKVIPDLPTKAYEVNKTGDIRIARTGKVLPLEGFDIDYNMEVVEVRINGATYMLNGPIIARELFR